MTDQGIGVPRRMVVYSLPGREQGALLRETRPTA
jgi:hypothetical protein